MSPVPQLTVADVRPLPDSRAEQPILYIDRGDAGTITGLEVWASAYVPHGSIVTRRHDLIHAIGADATDDDIRECLPRVQGDVEETCSADRQEAGA